MRWVRVCSLVLVLAYARTADAQTGPTYDFARITTRMVVGSSSLPTSGMRIVGSGSVSTATGTVNPFVADSDGDVLEDTFTTVSTAGAYTWAGAGSFSSTLNVASTLNVNGFITSSSGTILRLGHQTRVETISPIFVWKETDQGTDGKNTRMYVENGIFNWELLSDAESTSNAILTIGRTGLVPGDLRLGAALSMLRPENNGGASLGSLIKKYFTINAWELRIDTLVAQEKIATIGGRVIVAPTTKLVRDLPAADTLIYVEHNQMRNGDVLWLEGDGLFEKMTVSGSYVDCSVAGACVIATGFRYGVTRNLDGTSANDWYAGDAVVNEGGVGDGYIDIYSDRSGTAIGYPGQVMSDFPIAYWRMDETGAGFSADQMNSVGNLSESGTQSAGLGVANCMVGPPACSGPFDPMWQNNTGGSGSGYLRKNNAANLQIVGDLTLEFIAHHTSNAVASTVISKNHEGEYHLQVETTGALTFCHDTPPTSDAIYQCVSTAAGFMPTGTTNHYAVVRDMTSSTKRVHFYRDGVLLSTQTFASATAPGTTTLHLGVGATDAAPANYFYGNIDEVAIYNYALSGDRIAIHSAARTSTALSKMTFGPTLCGNVRTGTAAFDSAERWCMGNLAGTYGYPSYVATYGFASGVNTATWVAVDATNGFRVMNAASTKMQFDTSGNGFLDGSLTVRNNVTVGTSGALMSGATAYDTTTGYWLDYNSGTPRFRIGTTSAGTSYLRWTGSALEMKSNTLTVDSTGIVMATNTAATYATNYGYRFSSGLGNSVFGVHAFETAGGRTLGVINTSDTPGKPVSAVLFAGATSGNASVDVTNNNAGSRGVTLNAISTMSLLNQTLSITSLTALQINGVAGLSTTVVVPCGTLTFTHGWLTSKGAC